MIVKQTKKEQIKQGQSKAEQKEGKAAAKVVRTVTHSFPRPLFSDLIH
ncbi:MAG: hypothetical protein Q9M16_07795 [Mariprofundus sp.]|nr:hypothetical protein [Mariprofundus sp.]